MYSVERFTRQKSERDVIGLDKSSHSLTVDELKSFQCETLDTNPTAILCRPCQKERKMSQLKRENFISFEIMGFPIFTPEDMPTRAMDKMQLKCQIALEDELLPD